MVLLFQIEDGKRENTGMFCYLHIEGARLTSLNEEEVGRPHHLNLRERLGFQRLSNAGPRCF